MWSLAAPPSRKTATYYIQSIMFVVRVTLCQTWTSAHARNAHTHKYIRKGGPLIVTLKNRRKKNGWPWSVQKMRRAPPQRYCFPFLLYNQLTTLFCAFLCASPIQQSENNRAVFFLSSYVVSAGGGAASRNCIMGQTCEFFFSRPIIRKCKLAAIWFSNIFYLLNWVLLKFSIL